MSEFRRCPKCGTKWKVKFLGRVEILAYFCEKCSIPHAVIVGPLELAEMPPQYRRLMTIGDCEELLFSQAYRRGMTLKELEEIIKKREKEGVS